MRFYLDAAWATDINAGTMWRVLSQSNNAESEFAMAPTADGRRTT